MPTLTDHDRLIRIDERTEALEEFIQRIDTDVDNLKSWRDKTVGAISVVSVVVGYLVYLFSKLAHTLIPK